MKTRRLFVLVALAMLVAGGACSHTKHHKHHHNKIPPSGDETAKGPAPKDTHFEEVKKAAAAQLQCPEEQINIVCLRRDADGECISIRADGCDKSYEYQFGDT